MAKSHDWEGPRLLSNLGILQTAIQLSLLCFDFIILNILTGKKESSAFFFFLAQIILCQHMDKTVYPNQLFSNGSSEPQSNIFVAQKRKKRPILGNHFSFFYCEKHVYNFL